MASIWLPSAGDQENRMRLPGSSKGKALNMPAQRGFAKKISATPQKGLAFSKQQQLQSSGGRAFGDISNLLSDRGSVITPARGKQLNKGLSSTKKPVGLTKPPQQHGPGNCHVTKVTPSSVKPVDTERDFFPLITETEEYSDVLPSSLVLGLDDVQRLVQTWKGLQRPSRPQSPSRSPSPPPSPSHLLLDDYSDLPHPRLLQPCGLEAVEDFSELQMMPMDW